MEMGQTKRLSSTTNWSNSTFTISVGRGQWRHQLSPTSNPSPPFKRIPLSPASRGQTVLRRFLGQDSRHLFFNDGSNATTSGWPLNQRRQQRILLRGEAVVESPDGNYQWDEVQSGRPGGCLIVGDVVTHGGFLERSRQDADVHGQTTRPRRLGRLPTHLNYIHSGPVYPPISNDLSLQCPYQPDHEYDPDLHLGTGGRRQPLPSTYLYLGQQPDHLEWISRRSETTHYRSAGGA